MEATALLHFKAVSKPNFLPNIVYVDDFITRERAMTQLERPMRMRNALKYSVNQFQCARRRVDLKVSIIRGSIRGVSDLRKRAVDFDFLCLIITHASKALRLWCERCVLCCPRLFVINAATCCERCTATAARVIPVR